MLALGTFFDADAAEGLSARYELRLGENASGCASPTGAIELDRGPADDPDAIIETDAGTLGAMIRQGRELADAVRAGDVKVEGDQRAVARFVGLFPQPRPKVTNVSDELVNVRYMVDDVEDAVGFYTTHFGFTLPPAPRRRSPTSCAATCGCCSAARRARPGGRCPTVGRPSRAAGTASTSSSTTSPPRSSGCAPRADVPQRHRQRPGGQQILLEDPAGNLIELFQPAAA